jgi:hypothetical protein
MKRVKKEDLHNWNARVKLSERILQYNNRKEEG